MNVVTHYTVDASTLTEDGHLGTYKTIGPFLDKALADKVAHACADRGRDAPVHTSYYLTSDGGVTGICFTAMPVMEPIPGQSPLASVVASVSAVDIAAILKAFR